LISLKNQHFTHLAVFELWNVAIVVAVVALFVGQMPMGFLAIHHPQMMRRARRGPAAGIDRRGIHRMQCPNGQVKNAEKKCRI
jgi:hypothetical protein